MGYMDVAYVLRAVKSPAQLEALAEALKNEVFVPLPALNGEWGDDCSSSTVPTFSWPWLR